VRLITAVISISRTQAGDYGAYRRYKKTNDRHCDAKKTKPLRNQTRAAQETA
jgi:hypothetical protein